MKISRVVIDVIERDTGSLKVIDERSDIGGKTTQGVLRLLTDTMAITRAQQARQMLKKGSEPVVQGGVDNYHC